MKNKIDYFTNSHVEGSQGISTILIIKLQQGTKECTKNENPTKEHHQTKSSRQKSSRRNQNNQEVL